MIDTVCLLRHVTVWPGQGRLDPRLNRKTRPHSGNHEVFVPVVIRLHFITKKSSEKTWCEVLQLKGAVSKFQI